ncbi:MAG TPA: DEAD/DEAH box helicase family protein [Candidatus Binatia bacterium]
MSPGHALLVPRRHIATWFDATRDEQAELTASIEIARDAILRRLHPQVPDGFNIGINVGAAGGQTVFHLHVHVIPRFHGDVPDPRGGVRHVIPARANYLRDESAKAPSPPPRALATGGREDPFLRHVRPLFARATDIAIIAAFVQDSGLTRLQPLVNDALARGTRIRIVTGDYLDITQASALRRLLDWQSASEAFETTSDDATDDITGEAGEPPTAHEPPSAPRGRLEARIVEVRDELGIVSFHPKSWRFEGDGLATAFVGSSNVSETALDAGVEWNLRVDRDRDPAAYGEIVEAFESWWTRARPLTADWVDAYAERVRRMPRALPAGEVESEELPPKPEPHEIQQAALDALAATRADGRKRGLVVMATGLGKTLLAAFDVEAVRESLGRMPRVLFIAHRSELLEQAAAAFRRTFPDARFGWFAADRSDTKGDVIFASVAKLSRPAQLERFILDAGGSPDYVIVDEVHHATAPSYRRILDRLEPGFVLGLTATPDRLDEADVVGLLDDNLVYRADLGVGIVHGRLSPFVYFGLADVVDYENIPWRNRRFDPAVLAQAVQTQARMERLWQAWNEHAARRSLVFCCSIAHARFVRDWLVERGVRAVAVYAAPGSDDRDEALEKLAAGELDAVCSVDLFNEGVDVPAVDRVVMLRPTESPIVFLQQLGRGLRPADGKERLIVIDFVGNHRVFLDRMRTLISLGGRRVSVRDFLEQGVQPDLPEGCSVDVELEAIDMLRRFLPAGASEVERAYRELRASRDERPTAAELTRLGYRTRTLRQTYNGWFDFVAREGDLDEAEQRVLAAAGDWLRELETTAMTKCFKMVVLEVLLKRDALATGMPFDELARLSHAYLLRFPELMRDLEGVKELDDPQRPDPMRWRAYWRKNPIAAWTGSRWFSVEDERLVSHIPSLPGDQATLAAMTRELVEWRLVEYVARARAEAAGDTFECVVGWKQRDPLLELPSRAARPDLPSGETDVRLPDGSAWRFRFIKDSCSIARPLGTATNQLPDLLRRWFGPDAGRPGTAFRVRFTRSPDGWWVEPASARVVPLARRDAVVTFPTLRAAAGYARATALADRVADAPGAETVRLPVSGLPSSELFAVRAVGGSMDGGDTPIRDGDWVVLRWARAARFGAVEGRVALVELPASPNDASPDSAYVLKRVRRDGDRWLLVSDSPGGPTIPASADTKVIRNRGTSDSSRGHRPCRWRAHRGRGSSERIQPHHDLS